MGVRPGIPIQHHRHPFPMTLNIETAALISLFVQSILYGTYNCFNYIICPTYEIQPTGLFLFVFALSCYHIWEQHGGDHGLNAAKLKILSVSLVMIILASIVRTCFCPFHILIGNILYAAAYWGKFMENFGGIRLGTARQDGFGTSLHSNKELPPTNCCLRSADSCG